MSGFALLFQRDGSPAPPRVLDALMDRLAHRGHDGSDRWVRGPVGMGHQHFWTLPEDVGSIQPLSLDDRLHLVFDGRLDNRPDLLRALDLNTPEGRSLPDAALVIRAYRRWGDSCFEHFEGPFALALYDEVERRVVLARDALGARTLAYYLDERVLVVASEPYAVLAHPAISNELNEMTLIRWYAIMAPHMGETFFNNVKEMKPAHAMSIDAERVREWRHWDIDPNPRIRYKREEEYAEHFLHLLHESVKARLRSPTRVGISLSGGYDSSSIAALAALELAPERLLSFSWIFDELTECDERPAIHAMVEHFNLEPTYIPADGLWPLRDWETWPHNPNMPEGNSFRLMKLRLEEAAAASGARVLLNGDFGNDVFSPGIYWLADWLSEGLILKAGSRFVQYLQQRGWSRFARFSLFRVAAGLLDTLPGGRLIRPHKPLQPPIWLLSNVQERLRQDMLGDDWPLTVAQSRKPDVLRSLLGSLDAHGYGARSQLYRKKNLEIRSPYYDRNLIAFIVAIPGYVLYDGKRFKSLVYHAMDGIWPELIRETPSIGLLNTLYQRGYEQESATRLLVLNNPNVRWKRYVLPDFVLGELFTSYGIKSVIPWRCLAAEKWQYSLHR